MSNKVILEKDHDTDTWELGQRGARGGVGFRLSWDELTKILQSVDGNLINDDEYIDQVVVDLNDRSGIRFSLERNPLG